MHVRLSAWWDQCIENVGLLLSDPGKEFIYIRQKLSGLLLQVLGCRPGLYAAVTVSLNVTMSNARQSQYTPPTRLRVASAV